MAHHPRLFLPTLPAAAPEHRVALAVVLALLALFLVAAPFAKVQLPRLDAFIPIHESALIINDVVTAVLLFGQFSILRSRGMPTSPEIAGPIAGNQLERGTFQLGIP